MLNGKQRINSQVRETRLDIQGNFSMNSNKITDVGTPTLGTDVATKAFVEGLVDSNLKAPDDYNASVNTYPTLYKGVAVQEGDAFYITVAGIMGTSVVNVGDLLVCKLDTPAQVDANWYVLESNRDQATETIKGVVALATQGETTTGTDDVKAITPLKLKQNIDSKILDEDDMSSNSDTHLSTQQSIKAYADNNDYLVSGSTGTHSILTKGNAATGGDATGNYSTSFGYGSVASNAYAVAFGHNNVASGIGSLVAGYNSVASGAYSTAFGESSTASGTRTFVCGLTNDANSTASAIIGGINNTILVDHDNSVILGGNGLTSDNDNTIYTATLKTKGERIAISTATVISYSVSQFDEIIRLDASSNTVTLTLPLIDTSNDGQVYTLKTKDISNTCEVNTNVADSFEDATTTYTFSMVDELIQIVADLSSNQWVRID